MTPGDRKLFESLTEEEIMALTIYGEAEGESQSGKCAVGFVIKNRSELWQKSIMTICVQKNQFECFNDGNPRLPILKALADPFVETGALWPSVLAARTALSNNCEGNVGQATFYKRDTCYSPWFAKEILRGKLIEVATVGHHDFFEEDRFRSA